MQRRRYRRYKYQGPWVKRPWPFELREPLLDRFVKWFLEWLWKKRGEPYIIWPPYDPLDKRQRQRFEKQPDGSYRNEKGCKLNEMIVESVIKGVDWHGNELNRWAFL